MTETNVIVEMQHGEPIHVFEWSTKEGCYVRFNVEPKKDHLIITSSGTPVKDMSSDQGYRTFSFNVVRIVGPKLYIC